ncbi:MAG: tetratricopeptide repeat protein [Pseudomonadota bacterium]
MMDGGGRIWGLMGGTFPEWMTRFAVCASVFIPLLGLGACLSDEKLYAMSTEVFRGPAERGDPGAQVSLANMYNQGRGVPQDDVQAVYWLGRAAEQGHHEGQIMLGAVYADGHGVPQDDVQAYKWLTLASLSAPDAEKRQVALQARQMASTNMRPEQIAEAERLVAAWRPKAETSEAGAAPK